MEEDFLKTYGSVIAETVINDRWKPFVELWNEIVIKDNYLKFAEEQTKSYY